MSESHIVLSTAYLEQIKPTELLTFESLPVINIKLCHFYMWPWVISKFISGFFAVTPTPLKKSSNAPGLTYKMREHFLVQFVLECICLAGLILQKNFSNDKPILIADGPGATLK